MSSEEYHHIRRLFQDNAPEVSDAELLPGLRSYLAGKSLPKPRRSGRRRAALVTLATCIVVAAVGVGIYEAVIHMGKPSPIVVITDDPTAVPSTPTSVQTGTEVSSTTTSSSTLRVSGSEDRPYGFDVRQPFIDYDATEALGDPAYKIVTTWIAVGNRQEVPLSFSLRDLTLIDAYNHLAYPGSRPEGDQYYFTETVTPIWSPALEDVEIAPDEIVGGYVSWKVPWYVWPQAVAYAFAGNEGGSSSYGWQGLIFSDVNAGNRFYIAIGKLLYRGVIEGSEDEPFRPEDAVTAAEFAQMIVRAAAPYNQADFTYPAGYIEEATREGLVTWDPQKDSQALTRLEVALAVATLGRDELGAPPASYELPFTDIPESAKEDLALLAYSGIIGGVTETSFNPDGSCSRGQASRMLALLLDPRYREEELRLASPTSLLPPGVTSTTTSK